MISTGTAALLFALLSLYPGPQSQCIRARSAAIVANADATAASYGVPASILLATGFLETHLTCDRDEGGGLGAPIDRAHRHVAGGWDQHGSALRLGFERCHHDWTAAISHYRIGRCRGRIPRGYTAEYAMHVANRLEAGPRR